MLDILDATAPCGVLPARGPPFMSPAAQCASYPQISHLISKSPGWGGARANSGGARAGAGRPRKLVELPVDALCWYCLRTDHMAELLAHRELSAAGFEVFAPTIWKAPEEMRRYTNGSVRRARPARVVPMFRRYIFVRLSLADPEWHHVKDLAGVAYWIASAPLAVGVPGLPIAVREAAIEWVRGLLINGCMFPPRFFDAAGVPLPVIEAGTRLQMAEGPLAERDAFCRVSDGKRVEMMMRMFNRDVPVRTRQSGVVEPDAKG